MIIDRTLIVQALFETKEETKALLAMAGKKTLNILKAALANLLLLVGVGFISLDSFIGFIFGKLSVDDLIPTLD